MKAVINDAGQKYRTALLETFDMRDITFLKRASWGGIVAETDRLYSTMFHDWDALQKDCNDIEKAVKSLDWSVNPQVKKGEKVTPEAEKVAQVVEAALWKQGTVPPGEYSHNFAQLLGVLCHAIWRGQNVHRIVWKNNGELVYPARFEQLLPQFLQWEMEPGAIDRMLLIPDGEAAQPVPFPKYNYIVALNNSGPDHPLYNATYYSLVAWFAAFKKGLGWFMQFCERFGLPKPVIHYDNPEDKENIIAQLNDQRVINAILLEGDKQVEWAQIPASGQSLPQRELLTMAESACHKAILGQTLTSDVSKGGGSLAQAKVHAGVQADTVMRYAEYVSDIINTQLIPAIVHLNFGRADMPMPELRCKLPQNVANIERVQFWGQVLQIPGMQVIKSDIYDSLGIAMPAEGDEVLSTPAPQENALEKAMQGFTPDKGRKDETALAARTKEDEPKGIEGWLAPLKKKLLEAKKTGASFEQLKQMMLEAQLNTRALAGAMADNIKSGFFGEEATEDEEVDAANPYGCNQYGEGWRMPHNGKQTLRKNKDAESAPDTKELDDSIVDDDDDSEEAMNKRQERLDKHARFAEEMKKRLSAWLNRRDEAVKAAAGTEDDKRPYPVQMPDGTMCHTYGCEKHKDADSLAVKQADKKLTELTQQAIEAYNKGKFDKAAEIMKEHEKVLAYAEKCSKNIQTSSLHVIGEAKTREQAIKDTKSILPEHLRKKCIVEFDDSMTLHEINEYNKALKELVDKYPTPYLFRLGSTYVRNGGVLALATPTSLHVNHDKQKDGIHVVGKLHKYKYYSQAGFNREVVASTQKQQDQMKAIISHEYGHVIFMNTKEEARNKSNPNYAAFKEATKSLRAAFRQARKNGDIKTISEYGNTNEDEFFSECLAAREMGEKLPSYINNALDNVLKTSNMK